MDDSVGLERDVDELPDRLRTYVEQQVEDWRKVPYLALQADGRTGHSGQYAAAYRRGVWPLNQQVEVDCATGELLHARTQGLEPVPENRYEAAVVNEIVDAGGVYEDDLAETMRKQYGDDGVDAVKALDRRRDIWIDVDWNYTIPRSDPAPAGDQAVLELITDLDVLDAGRVVVDLETRASQPHGSYYEKDEKIAWRQNLEEWTGVDPVFERETLDDMLDRWTFP